MSLIARFAELSTFLDRELQTIEVSYKVLSRSIPKSNGEAAEIASDLQYEIKEINSALDQLIALGEDSANRFESFLASTETLLEEFRVKVKSIKAFALENGLATEEAFAAKVLVANIHVESPVAENPDALNGLKNLSENNGNNRHEIPCVNEASEDDDDDSPILSILKKPPKRKSLLQQSFNHSRVEISPGLFVRRPSSKLKGEPKEEPSNGSDASPILPNLNTVDLTSQFPRRCNVDDDQHATPELPVLQSKVGKLLSEQKLHKAISNVQSPFDEEKDSPQIPILHSHEANIKLSTKKKNLHGDYQKSSEVDDSHIFSILKSREGSQACEEEEGSFSPVLPTLKTLDLASILGKQSVDSDEMTISASIPSTPELPVFQSKEGKLLSAQKLQKTSSKVLVSREDLEVSPEIPILHSSEANVRLSAKKPTNNYDVAIPTTKGLEKESVESDNESPTFPRLKTIDLATLLGKQPSRKNEAGSLEEQFHYAEGQDDGSSQVGFLHDQVATMALSAKKKGIENVDPQVIAAEKCPESPQLPELKTINLATLLQKAKGTIL